MTLNLQNDVTSTQDLKSIIIDVRKYAHWFGQSTVKLRRAAGKSEEQPPVSDAASRLINDLAEQEPLSQKRLDELIAALEELEKSSPRITITLAAVPPGSLKKSLADWCRQNIAPNVLVDFRFNATLLGGMVVQYGSHVYDWSFRRQILAARGKFPEVLRRV